MDPFQGNSDLNVIDKKLMANLKMKEVKNKIEAAKAQVDQLTKKKKKLGNRMIVMPKQEEIRIVADKMRVVKGEIANLKAEAKVKQQAIKYIKQGQDDLVQNDSVKVEKNEKLLKEIQEMKKMHHELLKRGNVENAVNKQMNKLFVDETQKHREYTRIAKEQVLKASKVRSSINSRQGSAFSSVERPVVTQEDHHDYESKSDHENTLIGENMRYKSEIGLDQYGNEPHKNSDLDVDLRSQSQVNTKSGRAHSTLNVTNKKKPGKFGIEKGLQSFDEANSRKKLATKMPGVESAEVLQK